MIGEAPEYLIINAGKINVSSANGQQWQMLQLNMILEFDRSIDSKAFATDLRTVRTTKWEGQEGIHIKGWGASTMRGGLTQEVAIIMGKTF